MKGLRRFALGDYVRHGIKRTRDWLVSHRTAIMYTGAGGCFTWGSWTISMTLGIFTAAACLVVLELLSDGGRR